jgi:hypothetical protein
MAKYMKRDNLPGLDHVYIESSKRCGSLDAKVLPLGGYRIGPQRGNLLRWQRYKETTEILVGQRANE